ncbi:MAG: S9 family peptidase [Flavobacteriaceae bacterium]
MKKLSLLILFIGLSLNAQQKEISLEDIWQGTFRASYMNSLNSMNGDYYSIMNYNRSAQGMTTSVDQYSYQTLEKTSTIIDSKDLDIPYFESYQFNSDESKLILGTELNPIYRHSKTGMYYVYDRSTKSLELIDESPIQEPTFSPDSNKVAFVKQNNIYIKDFVSGTTTQVTFDGKINEIINGISDWVYEEEFSKVKMFDWNANSSDLAFIRFDERQVPEFSMDIYGNGLYPTQQVFKYPKAGEPNSKVSLFVYNLENKKSTAVDLGAYEYIPRIQFSKQSNILTAMTLNRHQNDLKLLAVNTEDFKVSTLIEETDKAYVDIHDNLTFLDDNSMIWTSEKSGFNHIYHYASNGKLIKQITSGPWEVTNYYGYNSKTKTLYYQSVETGSINRGVYSIKLNGKSKKLLSSDQGTNNASFSKNMEFFILTYTDASTPAIYTLHNAKGKQLKEILNNNTLSELYAQYNTSKKEYFELETSNGTFNAWMIKPSNFDPAKKYPLFMTQYSGPGSQSVSNSWGGSNDLWYQMLAQKGIIVVCIDGRGTGLKGADFKKVTYQELGKYEVEDQIESAKVLGSRSYIDENRIGIWGWSYGGFMSTNCILKGNDVFEMAIAVAPVTSWRYYDSVYTERYMRTPQENPSGYDENSPIFHAAKLTGKYLLIHGTGDDNVHVQNTMQMINALVKENKQFDLMIYPDRAHGIYRGQNTRLQLYQKMTNFIESNL